MSRVVLFLLFAGLAAEELTVTNLDDSGLGSLRNALILSQDGDIISFDPNLSGSILLQSDLPSIGDRLKILGSQSRPITIDGRALYRIFDAASSSLAICQITLKNGFSAFGGKDLHMEPGSVASLSNLTIDRGSIAGQAVYVDASGMLTMRNVTFTGNGAGRDVYLNDGALVLVSDGSSQPTFSIDGMGNVLKKGPGTIALTVYSPTIDLSVVVDEGSLIFIGKANEPVMVNSKGTLYGTHSVLYLANNGTINPGVGIGSITTAGDYYQSASATLLIDLDPSQGIDLVSVGGNAQLNGSLVIQPTFGTYLKGDSYTFLTSGGLLNGSFQNVSSSAKGLAFALVALPNGIGIVLLKNILSMDGTVFPGNGGAVQAVIENADITKGSDWSQIVGLLNALDPPDPLEAALIQLQPSCYSALGWTDAATMHQIRTQGAQQPFFVCRKVRRHGFWVNGLGGKIHQNGFDSLPGFHTFLRGVVMGCDYSFKEGKSIGVSGAYSNANLRWQTGIGKAEIQGAHADLHSAFILGRFWFDASFLASAFDADVHRQIDFTGLNRVAESSPKSYGLLGHFGAKAPIPLGSHWRLMPFAMGDYTFFFNRAFQENGAGSLDLMVEAWRPQFVRGEAGMQADGEACFSRCALFWRLGLSWVGIFPVSGTPMQAAFLDIPEAFPVVTTKHRFNEISPVLLFGVKAEDSIAVSLSYAGEFGAGRSEQTLDLNLRWQF